MTDPVDAKPPVMVQKELPLDPDGSPHPVVASVTGLPVDVTQVGDQLIHTHQDTGERTLLGRVRANLVEMTEWGKKFFENQHPITVTGLDGKVVQADQAPVVPAPAPLNEQPLQVEGL